MTYTGVGASQQWPHLPTTVHTAPDPSHQVGACLHQERIAFMVSQETCPVVARLGSSCLHSSADSAVKGWPERAQNLAWKRAGSSTDSDPLPGQTPETGPSPWCHGTVGVSPALSCYRPPSPPVCPLPPPDTSGCGGPVSWTRSITLPSLLSDLWDSWLYSAQPGTRLCSQNQPAHRQNTGSNHAASPILGSVGSYRSCAASPSSS